LFLKKTWKSQYRPGAVVIAYVLTLMFADLPAWYAARRNRADT